MAVTKDDIIEALKEMKLLEIKELVDAIEETFDVKAATGGGMMMAAMPGAGPAAAAEEEKTEFDVILAGLADTSAKIKVIKVVRALTNLNLKEAKDLVEGAPKEVVKGASKDDAEKAKKDLEEAGAKVELK